MCFILVFLLENIKQEDALVRSLFANEKNVAGVVDGGVVVEVEDALDAAAGEEGEVGVIGEDAVEDTVMDTGGEVVGVDGEGGEGAAGDAVPEVAGVNSILVSVLF